MQILREKQAVLLYLRDSAKITTVIPTAKLVRHRERKLVAVPHRPDEVRVLRALGYKVPDPMDMYYKWPGRYKPFDAQKETSNFLAMRHRAFCLNSMGLGKTLSALWAYDYLRQCKQVKRALVVCPMSTMERTWGDEIFRAFPHLDVVVVYGTAERRKKLLAQKADIYIINTGGLKVIRDAMATREDIDLVILDELALFRNSGTDRWKAANVVINKQTPRRVWGLTGSPIPNAPTDAWAQCRLLVPNNPDVPKYFNRFRDEVMRQVTQFKWVPKTGALDNVKRCMQPAIRFELDDVVDLPPQVFLDRDVELTKEQKKAFTEMVATLAAEYDGGQILAVNEAVKASKLVQIACGGAYGTDHATIMFPAAPRVDLIKETIDQAEGKVIIFVPFTGVLENLAAELGKDYSVAVVHGETPREVRDTIFGAFQAEQEPRVIVANPGTMSHGLTLTAASTIIWFAPVHSNEIYEQACARVRRPGQKRTTVIVHVSATAIERAVYTRLRNKQSVQGTLLDMIKTTWSELDEVV